MNALVKTENTALAAITETELCEVLRSSLYPGASLPSIKLVLGYCKASGLDPMKKPVHIVPMKVSTGEKDDRGYDIKETRDVIMPGVGMYRTEASRTGEYAGVDDPEFGPTQELEYTVDVWTEGDNGRRQKKAVTKKLRYPEWARVTVKRIVAGEVRSFSAREYWLENYATKSASDAPNEMWAKRPFGQLGKCAEAQALRKAFPDTTGSQPTADEMEGRDEAGPRHMGPADVVETAAPAARAELETWPDDAFERQLPKFIKAINDGKTVADVIAWAETKGKLTDAQRSKIKAPAATDAAPKVTADHVAERIKAAANLDALAEAAALIAAVPDEQARAELTTAYEQRGAALSQG